MDLHIGTTVPPVQGGRAEVPETVESGQDGVQLELSWAATAAVLVGAVALTALGFVAVEVLLAERPAAEVVDQILPWRLASGAGSAVADQPLVALALILPLPAALLLERWIAVPGQVGVGWRGIGEDAGWFALSMLLKVGLVALVYGGMLQLRDAMGIGLDRAAWLPLPVAFVLAFLLADLLRYWSHRLRHRSALLWRFHAVHHAQERLNPLTEHRVHPVDLLVHYAVFGLAFALLDVPWGAVALVSVVAMVHTRLYHASLRTDYGPLRHVLVTPQSHRIHHSADPAHHDTNFGTIFSIWDRLFGTAHPDVTGYPPAGAGDPTFPTAAGRSARHLPRVLAAQLVHPFAATARVCRRRPVEVAVVDVIGPEADRRGPAEGDGGTRRPLTLSS